MPPPSTKTPDPTAVPAGCDDNPYRAACYKKGYMEGYGRGYQRAYDDFHSSSEGKRKDKKTPDPDKHHYPPACKKGQERICYDQGYEDGYVAGYASAEVDVGDA
jgi:hypothetical protein